MCLFWSVLSLAKVLEQRGKSPPPQSTVRVCFCIQVRGYKTVVKFFPHEAQDLERVLSVLCTVKAMAKSVTSAEEGVAVWESQSILLLWLSMLILVPFDLATIDSTAVDMQDARSGSVD
jgi:hypothetical protein